MFGEGCHWSTVALVAHFGRAQAGCGSHSCFPSSSLSMRSEQESGALVQGRCWMRLLQCYGGRKDPYRQGAPWRWRLSSGQGWRPHEEREGGLRWGVGPLTCTPGLWPGGTKDCLVLILPSWLQALLEGGSAAARRWLWGRWGLWGSSGPRGPTAGSSCASHSLQVVFGCPIELGRVRLPS